MLKVLILILFITSSTVFAQTSEKKDAYNFFEYEKISSKLLEEKLNCSVMKQIKRVGSVGLLTMERRRKSTVGKNKLETLECVPKNFRVQELDF